MAARLLRSTVAVAAFAWFVVACGNLSSLRDSNDDGGVDANASKQHLMDQAKKLDIAGRSRMTKAELVEAIQKANDRSTRRARKNESA